MRHYIIANRISKARTVGLGSNSKSGVVLSVEFLTQSKPNDASDRTSLGTIQLVEVDGFRRLLYSRDGKLTLLDAVKL